jgi:alkylation response protein AidB-like acyl-CoA dehydrogenase
VDAHPEVTDLQLRHEVRDRVQALLEEYPPAATDRRDFLEARYDHGLAWVHFPPGLGGLSFPRELQGLVQQLLADAGAPDNEPRRNPIGLGMAAPTILAHGTLEQQKRFLRPLWLGDEIWCQLFSEPGAGSDLAALATRAVKQEADWVVNGQKVWTSGAHKARWGLLVARTDVDVPKHAGLTYFVCDMTHPGVDVRPLRQITGESEFNEVFLTDVTIPDAHRLGELGEGWKVANATLMNERVSFGGQVAPRESGMVGVVANTWRQHPERRTNDLHDRLLGLWVEAEVARLAGQRLRQKLAAGRPGPEGSAMKLMFARVAQQLSGLEMEMLGADALRYEEWDRARGGVVDLNGRDAGYRYLRAKGNSIEGGTSEILRNIIAERVLGMPAQPRADKNIPWKDLAK